MPGFLCRTSIEGDFILAASDYPTFIFLYVHTLQVFQIGEKVP